MKILKEKDNFVHILLGEKHIYLLGTAHVSQKSVQEVRCLIKEVKPDSVCIELCQSRWDSLFNEDRWKNMDIVEVIKKNRSFFLLMQLVLSSFYKRIGDRLGVRPGEDMIEASICAQEIGAEVVLADRDVNITLKRVWRYLSFWHKMKLLKEMLIGIFSAEEISEQDIEKLKDRDQFEIVLEEIASSLPEVKERLIDERDKYLAHKIKYAPGEKVVAVVGYGHLRGIIENISKDYEIAHLLEVPPPSPMSRFFKWIIPGAVVALITYGFFKGGASLSLQSIGIWIGVNGFLSALGVILAMGHPLAVFSAFVAAPITSLNPMIAAGWVAGLVQAWVKKPTVRDFERLPEDILSLKGFWSNPISKVLLVVALANIGSSLGTFLAGGWIASRIFSHGVGL